MGRPKKKQDEVALEDVELVADTPELVATEQVVKNKRATKEKKIEPEVDKTELTGTWKVELNPITFAVKYKCSNCGKYTIPNGRPASKIDKCIFCGSKNRLKK